jgi:hypothetical protein
MTRLCFFLGVLTLFCASCKSKKEIGPRETWWQSCSTFEVFEDGYRLSGLCCAYITIPKLTLYKDESFSAKGDYYAYTGAGFAAQPVTVSGAVSKDGKSLTLRYTVNDIETSLELTPGRSPVVCDCFCD